MRLQCSVTIPAAEDSILKTNIINIEIGKKQAKAAPALICNKDSFALINNTTRRLVGALWSFDDGTYSTELNSCKELMCNLGNYSIKLC